MPFGHGDPFEGWDGTLMAVLMAVCGVGGFLLLGLALSGSL